MKVTFETLELRNLLPKLKKITDAVSDAAIPVLKHILVSATKDKLRLIASNVDQYLILKALGNVEEEGRCLIPTQQFDDLVSNTRDDEITVSFADNTNLVLSTKSSSLKCPTLTANNFPVIPKKPETEICTVDASYFLTSINQTSFAMARGESRYAINGSLMKINNQEIEMVATDGHRLALTAFMTEPRQAQSISNTIISRQMLQMIPHIFLASGKIEISRSEEWVWMQSEISAFAAAPIKGDFPNYAVLLPPPPKITTSFPAKELEQAVLAASCFSDPRSQGIKLKQGEDSKLTICSQDIERGEFFIKTNIDYSGFEFMLNAHYLLDVLNSIQGEVEIMVKGPQEAIYLRPAKSQNTLHLIMPMRF